MSSKATSKASGIADTALQVRAPKLAAESMSGAASPVLDREHNKPSNVAWPRCLVFGPIILAWLAFMLFLVLGDVHKTRQADTGLYGTSIQFGEERVLGRPLNDFEQSIFDKARWSFLTDASGRYVPFFLDFVSSGRYNRDAHVAAQNASAALDTTVCTQVYADRVMALVANEMTRPAEARAILSSFYLGDFPPGGYSVVGWVVPVFAVSDDMGGSLCCRCGNAK